MMDGHGVFNCYNDYFYEVFFIYIKGQYKNNKKHGHGILMCNDGD